MRMNEVCLPCLLNQVIKVADLTGAQDREELFKKVFLHLGGEDLSKTSPEIMGAAFRILKEHTGNSDPYRQIREQYNRLFLDRLPTLEQAVLQSPDPFSLAVKYAIMGNIIDFGPNHNLSLADVDRWFADADALTFTVDKTQALKRELATAGTLLYLGDNCGEICLDKLLLRQIKRLNPELQVYFGVRGAPVVNDSIEADAYAVGMDEVATIVSNGDDSQGTVLERTSPDFNRIYAAADVVIAKGQANYESLSEQRDKSIYFLLVAKCRVIADYIGVPERSVLCLAR